MRAAALLPPLLGLLLAAAGCAPTPEPAAPEPAPIPTAASASSPIQSSSSPPPRSPQASPTDPDLTADDLTSVLIRNGDKDFGVEWSLLGPAKTPGKQKATKPACEEFDRGQYAPSAAAATVSQEWLAESGSTGSKRLTQVATVWSSTEAAQDWISRYMQHLRSCSQYRSGPASPDAFAFHLRKFSLKLAQVGSSEHIAWQTRTTIPSMADVPATYQSTVVLRRRHAIVLLQYVSSDLDQPPAVGRSWVTSYARTVAGRLDTVLDG